MIVVLQQAHDPIVRYVAEQQVAAGAEICGTLGPAEAGGDTFDRAGSDTALEPLLVQGLDVGVGVARAGQADRAAGVPSPEPPAARRSRRTGPRWRQLAALSVAAVALAADAAMNARLFMDPPRICPGD